MVGMPGLSSIPLSLFLSDKTEMIGGQVILLVFVAAAESVKKLPSWQGFFHSDQAVQPHFLR